MELKNRKINFLGDSITEGVGVSSEENIYLNVIKREASLAEARNYGISGTRIARQQRPSKDPRMDLDFVSRVEEMDADADVVVVFGGTNDYGHGDAPFGTFADRTPDTFYGACHTLMSKLIHKYPLATIAFVTPMHRLDDTNLKGEGYKEVNVAPLSVYVDIIKEVAVYYALPVLDLFTMSGIQPNIPILRETYCPDGVHPNDAGNRVIASRLMGFLRTL